MVTNILFVDDEPNLLAGLRRLLRGFRQQWAMEFANGGEDALRQLEARQAEGQPFDVVVTDMRMPGMDGADLLREVARRRPETVRMVLSGQSEPERILRAVGRAHQYLSKPCDPETLRGTVARACQLRDTLPSEELKRAVSRTACLPVQPGVLDAVRRELRGDDEGRRPGDAPLERIAELVRGDIGLSAKIMQLVSTAFFGTPQSRVDAIQATKLLGVELLDQLANQRRLGDPWDPSLTWLRLDELSDHCRGVADCARRIVLEETGDSTLAAHAHTAGMLHDVGKLVLARAFPGLYLEATRRTEEQGMSSWCAEMQVFGASHAEVGSYLLGLWGLPSCVVEAVRSYRAPDQILPADGLPTDDTWPLLAVHAANILTRSPAIAARNGAITDEYLRGSRFAERLMTWRELAGVGIRDQGAGISYQECGVRSAE